jgi:hypothetical protein
LKREISFTSQDSSPPGDEDIISMRATAAALPGVELPGRRASEVALARAPAGIKGGKKERGGQA